MTRILTRRLFPALLLLSARSVFAIDGQVLINESTVTAQGGYPYRITQAGSYKLSGNLTAYLNHAAILIEASNVTLDLNGFTISCSAQQPGGPFESDCVSDNGQPLTSVTVRNGTISMSATAPSFVGDNAVGLALNHSHASTIEDMHFTGSGTNYAFNGITTGTGSLIRRNTFAGNASPSISCPSVVTENVNTTGGAGTSGTGCEQTLNLGLLFI